MDETTAQRIAATLDANRAAILESWSQAVRDTLRGRLTRSELERQLEDLYTSLRSALGAGVTTVDSASPPT